MAELLERVGSAELTEWMGLFELEPWGGHVDDLRAGLAAAMTLNVNMGEKGERAAPLDFYPWHNEKLRQKPEPETPERIAERIKAEIFKVGKP